MATKKVQNVPVKKVAIVGCADSKHLAPFNDPEFEIWGVNNLYPHIPRATRWFEIHQITKQGDTYLRRGNVDFRGQKVNEYLEQLGQWAKTNNAPVYMQRKCDIIPTSVEFPLKEVLEKFGNYFTNSISYQIALAILEGFQEIHIYGVDMAVDSEYHHQRPSCEYFLGIAAGLGIKVFIPDQADLLKTRFLYGFQEPEQAAWKKKVANIRATMAAKKKKIEDEIKVKEAQLHQYIGASQAVTELDKIWG